MFLCGLTFLKNISQSNTLQFQKSNITSRLAKHQSLNTLPLYLQFSFPRNNYFQQFQLFLLLFYVFRYYGYTVLIIKEQIFFLLLTWDMKIWLSHSNIMYVLTLLRSSKSSFLSTINIVFTIYKYPYLSYTDRCVYISFLYLFFICYISMYLLHILNQTLQEIK